MPRLALAVALLFAAASPTIAQQPGRAADPAIDAVPTDAFAFVSVKVSKLWDHPTSKPFRDWVATQQKDGILESILGVPFSEIDRVTVIVPTLEVRENTDEPVVLITTRAKYTDEKVLAALSSRLDEAKKLRLTGRMARLPGGPTSAFRTVMLANDRTLVFSGRVLDQKEAATVLARLKPRKANTPLSTALTAANTHDIVAGLNLGAMEAYAKEKGLEPLALFKAKSTVLTADVGQTAKGNLVMTFADANAARQGAKALEDGIKLITTELDRDAKLPRGDRLKKSILGRVANTLKNAKVTVNGSNAVVSAEIAFEDDLAKVVAALPKSLKQQVLDVTTANNLKQIGLAMHNFESAFSYFPGDIGFADKPGATSWRVMIMPYFDAAGADQFTKLDFTKPLDDPKNLKVLEAMEMPKLFEHPGRPAPKGHTYFRIFTIPKNAKGTDRPFFKEGERGPKIGDITDGTSNTFLIVEAGEAVPWYKPDVLAYDGKLPLPQLGDKEADEFFVVFGDGSVRKIKRKLDEKTLRALITINGGEVAPDLDK